MKYMDLEVAYHKHCDKITSCNNCEYNRYDNCTMGFIIENYKLKKKANNVQEKRSEMKVGVIE